MGNCGRFIGNLNFKIFSNFITDISFYKFCEISLIWKMQEKICLKRTGNTGHFMESERNLYEYSNSFRHHTSGICTTGSECLRSGLSHHWIKLNRQYHIEPSKTFNSLPHTEVDKITMHRCIWTIQYFNSLPHTEVDVVIHNHHICRSISTHYLTQK